jgi:hypothetical protein
MTPRAKGGMSEADLYVRVDPNPAQPPTPPSTSGGIPLLITAPLAFVGLISVLRTIKAIVRRG